MQTLFASVTALVFLVLAGMTHAAEASQSDPEAWIHVFAKQSQASNRHLTEFIIQNKSELAITAIEIGRKSACFGTPSLDLSDVPDVSMIQAPAGFTAHIVKGTKGGAMLRFEGRSTENRLSGFVIPSSNPALLSGHVCIYRADAKVWQYKAAVLLDEAAPQLTVSLNPSFLESDKHFHEIKATLVASDRVDAQPEIKLLGISSNRSDFNEANEIRDAAIGTDDRSFLVLADKVGRLTVVYEVTDAAGNSAQASGTIETIFTKDTVAPQLSVVLNPSVLKGTGNFTSITATIKVRDNKDPQPKVRLLSIKSKAKDFSSTNDVRHASLNTDDRSFQLLAKKLTQADRVYEVTYAAIDAAGNQTTQVQTVIVQTERKSAFETYIEAIFALLKRLLAIFF